MAPELLEGAISLNVISFLRVDIYACGLVLWEILSRTQLSPDIPVSIYRLPFEEELGLVPTNASIHSAIVHKRVRPALKDSWKNDPVSRVSLLIAPIKLRILCPLNVAQIKFRSYGRSITHVGWRTLFSIFFVLMGCTAWMELTSLMFCVVAERKSDVFDDRRVLGC